MLTDHGVAHKFVFIIYWQHCVQAIGSNQGPTHHGVNKKTLTNQKMKKEGKKKKLKSVNGAISNQLQYTHKFFTGGKLPGHVEQLLEAYQRGQEWKKTKKNAYLACILVGRKGQGQGWVGRKRVEEVESKLCFVWLSTKGLRQISSASRWLIQKKLEKIRENQWIAFNWLTTCHSF